MSIDEAKTDIRNLTIQGLNLIPATFLPNLPELEGMASVPNWHDYESKLWALGEQIRKALLKHKALRKDRELLDLFLRVCLKRNAKRGRQSFILLFGYKDCAGYAPQLVTQIDDEFVCGHILSVLNKMQADGYASIVQNFTEHKITWIRNEARKYVSNRN